MAKKAMIEREKKRQKLVDRNYAAKRAELKEIAADESEADGRAVQGAPEAGETAAQLIGDTSSQPLPADRPSACLLP